MSDRKIIIAVDGYSSTGKSSFAKMIARAYGLIYLDSGALYRAVTLYAMEGGFIRDGVLDISSLAPFLGDLNIHFEFSEDGSINTYIGGRNVENEIRTLAVSNNVSNVSACYQVRNYVDAILHEYGKKGGIIMDGRDIGTKVFPSADLKLFMTADTHVRAVRRSLELQAKGQEADIDEVLKNIQERDYIDSHREVSPLRRADDAIDLDNSNMTIQEQMEWVAGILSDKFSMKPIR